METRHWWYDCGKFFLSKPLIPFFLRLDAAGLERISTQRFYCSQVSGKDTVLWLAARYGGYDYGNVMKNPQWLCTYYLNAVLVLHSFGVAQYGGLVGIPELTLEFLFFSTMMGILPLVYQYYGFYLLGVFFCLQWWVFVRWCTNTVAFGFCLLLLPPHPLLLFNINIIIIHHHHYCCYYCDSVCSSLSS